VAEQGRNGELGEAEVAGDTDEGVGQGVRRRHARAPSGRRIPIRRAQAASHRAPARARVRPHRTRALIAYEALLGGDIDQHVGVAA
jgi:hypothetical protein